MVVLVNIQREGVREHLIASDDVFVKEHFDGFRECEGQAGEGVEAGEEESGRGSVGTGLWRRRAEN